jgi:hypothetical protein
MDQSQRTVPRLEIDVKERRVIVQAANRAVKHALALTQDGDAVSHQLDFS